jgi:DNA-binding IclR family transcriptional regulator
MQPVNLPVGVFSRAEQRVLQSIFKAIAEGGGRCVATLETLARNSNTSKSTARNAIARAVAIGLLEKTERRYCGAVSLPNILRLGQLWQRVLPSESTYAAALSKREWPVFDSHMQP